MADGAAPDEGARAIAARSLALPAQYAVFPVSLVVVWQLCAQIGFLRRSVLPAPTDVAFVWFDLITGATDAAARYSGTWLDHAAASIWRVLAGFAWGGGLGTVTGLLIGLSRIMERVLDPTIHCSATFRSLRGCRCRWCSSGSATRRSG